MSRSSASFRASACEADNSASNLVIRAACDSGRSADGDGAAGPAVVPEPGLPTHSFNEPRETPRSIAMPFNVAPGMDSYKSTARRRNSSE